MIFWYFRDLCTTRHLGIESIYLFVPDIKAPLKNPKNGLKVLLLVEAQDGSSLCRSFGLLKTKQKNGGLRKKGHQAAAKTCCLSFLFF